jgi:Uma2 family endonuclease
VWGAPDLVVEILSPRTARRDRTTKLAWYRRYGVIECWLVDVTHRSVEVVELQAHDARRIPYSGDAPMHSTVLPNWTVAAAQIFS